MPIFSKSCSTTYWQQEMTCFILWVSYTSRTWKISYLLFPISFLHHSVSLATSSAHLEDLAYLDEQQRHVPSRTSLRMPRQNSGSRSQQDHRGKHIQTSSVSHCLTSSTTSLLSSPLLLQFVSLPLSTWSPSTSRSPVYHLIGCSPAGSGSSSRWMLVFAAVTHRPVGA